MIHNIFVVFSTCEQSHTNALTTHIFLVPNEEDYTKKNGDKKMDGFF